MLWIGVVLMPIRVQIRISVLMPIPDPDPDCHQNDADPHADPTISFTHVEK
jgi:hypothetical protein